MDTPADLQSRGEAVWLSFNGPTLPAGNRALVLEIARCADALDQLHALLAGRRESWLELIFDGIGDVTLVVDKLLAERRQYQLALQRLLSEARSAGLKEKAIAGAQEADEPEEQEQPAGRGGIILKLQKRNAN